MLARHFVIAGLNAMRLSLPAEIFVWERNVRGFWGLAGHEQMELVYR